MSAPLDVGFIGIGRMGAPMAGHVLDGGHRLFVCDVNPAAYASLLARGAVALETPHDIARHASIIVTSLPDPAALEVVALGTDGLLEGAHRELLIVETSTIAPATSVELARRFAAVSARYIDAPVSGAVQGARAGTLTAMVGGATEDVERALPVLRCFSERVRHLGPVGSGNTAKLINQLAFLGYVAMYCEAAALGKRAGLDVPMLIDVLRTSVAGTPLGARWDEHILAGDLRPGFQVDRVLKDLALAKELRDAQPLDFPVLRSAFEAFEEIAAAGYANADMTALYALRAGLAEGGPTLV